MFFSIYDNTAKNCVVLPYAKKRHGFRHAALFMGCLLYFAVEFSQVGQIIVSILCSVFCLGEQLICSLREL